MKNFLAFPLPTICLKSLFDTAFIFPNAIKVVDLFFLAFLLTSATMATFLSSLLSISSTCVVSDSAAAAAAAAAAVVESDFEDDALRTTCRADLSSPIEGRGLGMPHCGCRILFSGTGCYFENYLNKKNQTNSICGTHPKHRTYLSLRNHKNLLPKIGEK